MKNYQILKKISLAAGLTSISVVIDYVLKVVIGLSNFGLPFYAIPLVLGSVILGPIYGLIMALIGDFISVLLSSYAYMPLYALAAVGWGVIPGLLLRKKYQLSRLVITILLAYLFASLSNTFANYIYYGWGTTLATLALRLGLLPFNAAIIIYITNDVYVKLTPIIETSFKTYKHKQIL